LDMVAGKLINDHDTITLLQKIFAVVGTDQEFVLDGFPRTMPQADWLLSQVKHGQLKITAVVQIQISEEVVKARLLNRGRQDDTEEAITERFHEYKMLTVPIIDELKAVNIPVYDINGDQDIDNVQADIRKALGV
jgi:adenylate kinase